MSDEDRSYKEELRGKSVALYVRVWAIIRNHGDLHRLILAQLLDLERIYAKIHVIHAGLPRHSLDVNGRYKIVKVWTVLT